MSDSSIARCSRSYSVLEEVPKCVCISLTACPNTVTASLHSLARRCFSMHGPVSSGCSGHVLHCYSLSQMVGQNIRVKRRFDTGMLGLRLTCHKRPGKQRAPHLRRQVNRQRLAHSKCLRKSKSRSRPMALAFCTGPLWGISPGLSRSSPSAEQAKHVGDEENQQYCPQS
jgi:hypothetical protein